VNEKYPWRGVHAEAVNQCHGVKIPITHLASKTSYTLEARAFNDGVAFRHVIPGRENESRMDAPYWSHKLAARIGREGHLRTGAMASPQLRRLGGPMQKSTVARRATE
jgi:hypothetical protein